MQKPKLLILDGGGTVWDSMRVLYSSYLWAFDELGIGRKNFPLSMKHANMLSALKDFNTEHGKAKGFLALYLLKKSAKDFLTAHDPNEKLLEFVEEARNKFPDFDELSEKLGNLLDKYLYEIFDDTKYPLCPGAKEALKIFKEELNLKIALVSNRKRFSTLRILRTHGIERYFDLILAKEDQPKPKPSPEGVIKAMEHFSAKPEESVFVGDSAVDIISAKLARVKCIGVLTGMGDEELLRKAGAGVIVNTLLEVAEVLKNFTLYFKNL